MPLPYPSPPVWEPAVSKTKTLKDVRATEPPRGHGALNKTPGSSDIVTSVLGLKRKHYGRKQGDITRMWESHSHARADTGKQADST